MLTSIGSNLQYTSTYSTWLIINQSSPPSPSPQTCLDRNPHAFRPKVGQKRAGDERRHIKGCNCKRSGCLKNYCECYEAKIPCSGLCRCVGCKNLADKPENKSLMQLADAAGRWVGLGGCCWWAGLGGCC